MSNVVLVRDFNSVREEFNGLEMEWMIVFQNFFFFLSFSEISRSIDYYARYQPSFDSRKEIEKELRRSKLAIVTEGRSMMLFF